MNTARTLEISRDLLPARRAVSFIAAWLIAAVSLFVPDLTWVQIPSVVDWIIVCGAGLSVILSFTLLAGNRAFSTAQPLALMSSSLTATAAMVIFQSVRYVSATRLTILSICMVWQFFATFVELKALVERGKTNVPQKVR
jgi:hypothetical protein